VDLRLYNAYMAAMAKCGRVNEVLKAFKEMEASGLRGDVVSFCSVMNAHAKTGDFAKANDTFALMVSRGVSPNERAYSILIDAYAQWGHVDKAFQVLQDMESRAEDGSSCMPNAVTYSSLIKACGRGGQVNLAIQTFTRMKNAGIEPNVVTWTALIDACGKGGRIDLAHALFHEMINRGVPPNMVTCSAMISAFVKKGEMDIAFEVFDYMRDAGLRPSQVTYGSLLHACVSRGEVERAASLAQFMKDHDVSIQSNLTRPLMQMFSQARLLNRAFDMFERMIQQRQAPDQATLQTLFDAIDTGRELNRAAELFGRMRESTHISRVTYSAVLGACRRARTIVKAFLLFKDMMAAGVTPGESEYLSLMEACREVKDFESAIEVFADAKQQGVQPDVHMYTALMRTVSDEFRRRAARKLNRHRQIADTPITEPSQTPDTSLDRLPPSPSPAQFPWNAAMSSVDLRQGKKLSPPRDVLDRRKKRAEPSPPERRVEAEALPASAPPSVALGLSRPRLRHLDSMAYSLEEQHYYRENLFRIFLVFQEMQSSGVQPDLCAYNTLLDACGRAGEVEKAMEVFKRLVSEGLEPDYVTYTTLIKTFGIAGMVDRAEEVFTAMQQRTNHFASCVLPSELTFKQLMLANRNAYRLRRVFELFDMMQRQHGIRPTLRTGAIAIQLACEVKQVERALDIYRTLTANRVRLDNRSLHALLSLLNEKGLHDMASRIRQQRSLM